MNTNTINALYCHEIELSDAASCAQITALDQSRHAAFLVDAALRIGQTPKVKSWKFFVQDAKTDQWPSTPTGWVLYDPASDGFLVCTNADSVLIDAPDADQAVKKFISGSEE
jgi:hypothetical protein